MIAKYISTAGQVADIVEGQLIGEYNLPIEFIVSDSREIKDGNNLFVALKGENFNGHDFIPELIKSGKTTAVLSSQNDFDELPSKYKVAVIKCKDTLKALAILAANHRDSVFTEIIGVTGTNGKTTVKELLYSVISASHSCHKSEKNFNNEIGVPFTLFGLEPEHEFAVIEMGMNHAGEIKRLSQAVKPDIAVITSIGEGHIEFLKTVENIALAKSEIFMGMEDCTIAFVNRDCPYFNLICEQADKYGVLVKSYGLSKNAEYFPKSYSVSDKGIVIEMFKSKVNVPLYGLHNVYNVVGVMAICEYIGISINDIKKGFASFENISGRNEILYRGYTIINDTYNSNPSSVKSALKSMCVAFPDKSKTVIISDMLELGDCAESLHFEVGKFIAECNVDALFVFGNFAEHLRKGAVAGGMNPEIIFSTADREKFIGSIKDYKTTLSNNDVVLVKGSRSTKMEEVVEVLG